MLEEKKFTFSGSPTICLGEIINFRASGGLEQVAWTTLADTTRILSFGEQLVDQPAKTTAYRVTGRNCGVFVADTITIKVNPVPKVRLGKDTTLCVGHSLILDAGLAQHYEWQDGSGDRFLTAHRSGTYQVTVTNEFGCSGRDEIIISSMDVPVVALDPDTVLCAGFYPLDVGNVGDEYTWSTGEKTSSILPKTEGTYWVQVSNRCGSSTDTITVRNFDRLFVPNVITLNNDGMNEKFFIQGAPQRLELKILSRSGIEIFSATDYQNEWPLSPENTPAETYYYYLKVPGCDIKRKGWLQVIR